MDGAVLVALVMLHNLTVQENAGSLYANVLTSDVSVARLALVRAVEEWFDRVIAPEWLSGVAQLDSLPPLTVRVR